MKRKETKKVLTHHLYFCMRDFGHHFGEDTEIYFSLFDTKKSKYIRYMKFLKCVDVVKKCCSILTCLFVLF